MKNRFVDIQCSYCDRPFRTRYSSYIDGNTKSCGCLQKRIAKQIGLSNITHGQSKSGTYNSWRSMIQRCTNPNTKKFIIYGGRGITIYRPWYSFKYFLEDMGLKPKGLTLGRIDNNGNYEPENCRWETYKQQNVNRTFGRVCLCGGF
jgi:hypothetical protein